MVAKAEIVVSAPKGHAWAGIKAYVAEPPPLKQRAYIATSIGTFKRDGDIFRHGADDRVYFAAQQLEQLDGGFAT